jgi:hypothetical protein
MKKECCKDKDNLYVYERDGDLVTYKCRVCGCRHFELTMRPIKMNLKVK